jgi:predicted nuclease with RNAse H fold
VGDRTLLNRDQNRQHHPVQILRHLVVPESHNSIPIPPQFRRADRIFLRSVRVLTTIDFNRQLSRRAREIDNEASNRMLAAKFPSHTGGP